MVNPAQVAFELKSRTARRDSGEFFRRLVRNEGLTRDEIIALQRTGAVDIARFAAQETEYYADLFDGAGVDTATLADPETWARIPITDRTALRDREHALLSSEATRRTAVIGTTGGSTGQPLRIRRDARVPQLAFAWRMYRWWGVEPWSDLARVGRWGFGRLDSLKTAVSWWPSKQIYLDAKYLDSGSMASFHARLQRVQPALLEGYVGAMLEFADHVDKRGLTFPGLRAVATTAAPLTANVRARLESVYGVPVYDEYRSSEVNWIAGECRERNGLHIFADGRLVEIVDATGQQVAPGEVGDIVVTDLTNRVFPIIRYKLGDRGSLRQQECPCGVNLPLMDPVDGRVTDLIRLPGGAVVNHGVMAMFSAHPRSVHVFQVRQSADYSIKVLVVQGDDPDARSHIEQAVQNLRRQIRDEAGVTVEYVESLPSNNGKLKFLISEVKQPDGSAPQI